MNMSNNYAIRRENNQQQRMMVSQNYSLWQMDFSQNQQLKQRGWTQEDWQYQDNSREMNFDWQMTDINEAIRFSGGRERKQLIRQRDRMGLSHNMEEDQIDTQRSRQKELWADEDERFKKQKDYTLQLNTLDKQSFDTNRQQRQETYRMETENLSRKRDELEQQRALELEMTTLQRENQYKSIQLQKEAAGVQAWAAAKQQEYNLKLEEAAKNMGDQIGEIEQRQLRSRCPLQQRHEIAGGQNGRDEHRQAGQAYRHGERD